MSVRTHAIGHSVGCRQDVHTPYIIDKHASACKAKQISPPVTCECAYTM